MQIGETEAPRQIRLIEKEMYAFVTSRHWIKISSKTQQPDYAPILAAETDAMLKSYKKGLREKASVTTTKKRPGSN